MVGIVNSQEYVSTAVTNEKPTVEVECQKGKCRTKMKVKLESGLSDSYRTSMSLFINVFQKRLVICYRRRRQK